jgi:hypothetical protein
MLVKNLADNQTFEVTSFNDLLGSYPRVNGIRFNHVISVSELSTHSDDLTSQLDRLALVAMRANSDLIITSGKTARAENLKSSSHADMLIITRDEDLDIPAVSEPCKNKVLLTLDTVHASNQNIRPIGAVAGTVTDWYQSWLPDEYGSIVLECGLTLAREFFDADQVVEIDLTVTGTDEEHEAKQMAEAFCDKLSFKGSFIQVLNAETTWLFRIAI